MSSSDHPAVPLPPRVRFAPSPTGHLHIGGLRAALFNWLFAKHHKGIFLLRIEDTDLERSKDEYLQAIIKALKWTNITWDEELVIQSERLPEHQEVINQLLNNKKAYRCYCTPQGIKGRSQSATHDEYAKYDGHCRNRAVTPELAEMPFVVRFALPYEQKTISFHDIIRGPLTFEIDQFDDFIIARSDGRPMYNFVVVVDDAFMKITHIIRGDDHIPNTPKQIMLYQACGYQIPQFAHLPLILGKSGEPLSKRDGATSVMEYESLGYLPDALINYLVRLGWSHGDQELFTREELISYFSLDTVGKKGAIFDIAKLGWVNSMYMREMNDEALLDQLKKIRPLFQAELGKWHEDQIISLIALYKQRTKTILELADEIKSLYERSKPYLIEDISTWVTAATAQHIRQIVQEFSALEHFKVDILQQKAKAVAAEHALKIVSLAQPLRIALIGKSSGPGVFELMEILGKEESIKRLRLFLHYIDEHKIVTP